MLGLFAHNIRSLFDHTKSPAIPFEPNQLCYFHECQRDVLNHPINFKDLACHNALEAQSEAALVTMLLDVFYTRQPLSKQ
jgi:hypothetical protein